MSASSSDQKSEIRNQKSPSTRIVAGCMTGTSLDGLDAALAVIQGHGLEMKAHFAGLLSKPLGGLREELRHFASGGAAEPIRFVRAARRLGALHAEAVAELCQREGVRGLDFVVAHGQTIWHAPQDREASKDAGLSWQLFDPWPIVRKLKVPVCYDLRQADLIAGGQGAPITPIADWVALRDRNPNVDGTEFRVVVNLGGICNVTMLPNWAVEPERVYGRDLFPCNLLLDGLVRHYWSGTAMDQDGKLAAQGRTHPDMYEMILRSNPYFRRTGQRSTGREDFSDAWIRSIAEECRSIMSPHDALASAIDAIGTALWNYTGEESEPLHFILAGGGARNPALVERLRHCGNSSTRLTDDLGVPIEAREAFEFAILGALSRDGVPITLPRVTGAALPGAGVAGAWVYP